MGTLGAQAFALLPAGWLAVSPAFQALITYVPSGSVEPRVQVVPDTEITFASVVSAAVLFDLRINACAVSLIGVYPFERRNEVIIAYHVQADGEVVLNEELAEYRLILPEKLRPWDFGTGLAVRDWLTRRILTAN